MNRLFIVFFFSFFSFHAWSQTACSTAGVQQYSGGIMQFCDGTYWLDMKGASQGSCSGTTGGTIRYSGEMYQFCDGTNWYSMKSENLGGCLGTTAGTQRFSASTMQFCDGTNWYDMKFVTYDIIFSGIDSVSDITTTTAILRWTHVSSAVAYQIFNTTSGSPVFVTSVSAPDESYSVTGLNPNTTYRFRVKAQNALGQIDLNTNDVEFSTNAPIPPPSSLSLVSPTTSPGLDNTPTIRIGGVQSGDLVKLFTDSACTQQVGSGTASGTTIDITTSALTPANYTFYANSTLLETSECSSASVSYVLTSCPSGFVVVPGDTTLATTDFCVMKFEAKAWNDLNSNQIVDAGEVEADGCRTTPATCLLGNFKANRTAVSIADNLPWTRLNLSQARDACIRLNAPGKSNYALIANPEWMTIARNIENQNQNWSGGAVDLGAIFQGNNGTVSASSYNASSDPEAGSGRDSKALHVLSNGEQIWDLAGNVAEWVNWEVTPAQKAYYSVDGAPVSAWREFTLLDTLIGTSDQMSVNTWQPSHPSFNSSKGIGQYNAGLNTSGGAAFRGGSWADSGRAGIYALNLSTSATNTGNYLGLRCIFRP